MKDFLYCFILNVCVLSLSKWLKILRLPEGRPLLTVETEANGAHVVHMKRILPWLVRWARCAVTRDFCPALAFLVGPVQYKILFSQSCWVAYLLV
jgi:hypothetical protein